MNDPGHHLCPIKLEPVLMEPYHLPVNNFPVLVLLCPHAYISSLTFPAITSPFLVIYGDSSGIRTIINSRLNWRVSCKWTDTLRFLCFSTSQCIFFLLLIPNWKQPTARCPEELSFDSKRPPCTCYMGHKQHAGVTSKWCEHGIAQESKLGQIKCHRVMVANKFDSIRHIFIASLLRAGPCANEDTQTGKKTSQTPELRVR